MGMLSDNERRTLIELLLKLPNMNNPLTRDNLLAALPDEMKHSLVPGSFLSSRDYISGIVRALDAPGMELDDGTWAVSRLIEESLWISLSGTRTQSDLAALAIRVGLRQNIVKAGTTPEAIIQEGAGPFNIEEWFADAQTASRRVCRIETPSHHVGTGFLVGKDLVLTNWHVIEHEAHDPQLLGRARIRFDYRKNDRGEVTHGEQYALLAIPPVASSPYDDLDFALLRVKGQPGEDVIDVAGQRVARGWMACSERPLDNGEPLFVIQHPGGKHLQIAVDRVLASNEQRLRYSTNTQRGSSGSPCLDRNWHLVGLHSRGKEGVYNEGIPVTALLSVPGIRALLLEASNQGGSSHPAQPNKESLLKSSMIRPARSSKRKPRRAEDEEATGEDHSSLAALIIEVDIVGGRASRKLQLGQAAKQLKDCCEMLGILNKNITLLTGKQVIIERIVQELRRLKNAAFNDVIVYISADSVTHYTKLPLSMPDTYVELSEFLYWIDKFERAGISVWWVLDFNIEVEQKRDFLNSVKGGVVVTWSGRKQYNFVDYMYYAIRDIQKVSNIDKTAIGQVIEKLSDFRSIVVIRRTQKQFL